MNVTEFFISKPLCELTAVYGYWNGCAHVNTDRGYYNKEFQDPTETNQENNEKVCAQAGNVSVTTMNAFWSYSQLYVCVCPFLPL